MVVLSTNRLLVDWLLNHIKKTDHDLGNLLKGQGV